MNNFENQPSPLEKLAEKREKQRKEIESWVVSYLPTLGENLMVWVTSSELKSGYDYSDAVRVEVRDSITQEICAISIFENEWLDEISDESERKSKVLDTLKGNFDAQTSSSSFGQNHNELEVQKARSESPIEKLKQEIADLKVKADNLQSAIMQHNEDPAQGIDFGFSEQLEEIEEEIKAREQELAEFLNANARQAELRL